jgi:hypothetical protein
MIFALSFILFPPHRHIHIHRAPHTDLTKSAQRRKRKQEQSERRKKGDEVSPCPLSPSLSLSPHTLLYTHTYGFPHKPAPTQSIRFLPIAPLFFLCLVLSLALHTTYFRSKRENVRGVALLFLGHELLHLSKADNDNDDGSEIASSSSSSSSAAAAAAPT